MITQERALMMVLTGQFFFALNSVTSDWSCRIEMTSQALEEEAEEGITEFVYAPCFG